MTGSTINIIFITVAFALLAFALAYIIAYAVSANKIAAEERIKELEKQVGADDGLALVKNKSRKSKQAKKNKKAAKHGLKF